MPSGRQVIQRSREVREFSARSLQFGGRAYIDYVGLAELFHADHVGFFNAVESEWASHYHRTTSGARDVRAVTIRELTWVMDATTDLARDEPDNRLIGVYGTSSHALGRRDKARMRGYPSPQRDSQLSTHRGHAAAHSMGGPDEGYNLFPQAATVNLGQGWREQERYCAVNPGTRFFVRAIYGDSSDVPASLEYGVIRAQGALDIRYFNNR